MAELDLLGKDAKLNRVITAVSKDKNLDKALIVDALEQAVIHAARKHLGPTADLEAHYNEELDEIELFQFRTVVEAIADKEREVTVDEAHKLDSESVVGDSLGVKIEASKFGRIAAQSAKHIIVQKVRDAERGQVYEEFKDRVGEIMSGHVKRIERSDIIVDLGRAEAIIPYKEQVPFEKYRVKDRVQGYVVEVKRSSRGPQIVMSRAHTGFLVRLFEQTVTEIYDGIVSIEAAARDAGQRSKIAVYSRDSAVDPVGACVGMKGARVQAIVQELGGEKIDIIPYDRDPAKLVCNALAPAVVSKVIVDETNHSMEVIVGDDQLSLAIGKKGQNVRLAAQLTGWRLDIKSESKLEQMMQGAKAYLATIPGVGSMLAGILVNEGIKKPSEIVAAGPRILSRLLNLDQAAVDAIIEHADDMYDEIPEEVLESIKAKAVQSAEEKELFANSSAAPEAPKESKDEKADAISKENRADRIKMFSDLKGVGEAAAHALADAGYATIGDVVADSAEEVGMKTGLSLGVAKTIQIAADRYLQTLKRRSDDE